MTGSLALEYKGKWAIADEDEDGEHCALSTLVEEALGLLCLGEDERCVIFQLTVYPDEIDFSDPNLIVKYDTCGEIKLDVNSVDEFKDALYCFSNVNHIDEILTVENPPEEPPEGWEYDDREEAAMLYKV